MNDLAQGIKRIALMLAQNKYIRIRIIKQSWLYSLLMVLSLSLASCGSGSSESGTDEGELTIFDASELVGVYQGTETLTLTETTSEEIIEEQTNAVSYSVNQQGQLNIASSSGTTGTAQIREDRTFSLFSDARVQFNGRCTAGEIQLNGEINATDLTATYTSSDLVCDGTAHEISGTVTAIKP